MNQEQTERAVRQINDRIHDGLPPFLYINHHSVKLGEKIVIISASYKLNA